MAIGDSKTITRTVTLGANVLAAGVMTNTLTAPARILSLISNNANVVIVAISVDGVPNPLVHVGSVVVVTVLNLAASSQTAIVTATLVELSPRAGTSTRGW
jgi:hypothetical protein